MPSEAELDGLDAFDLMDAESARIDAFFASARPDELARPSRCEGWSAGDVLNHLLHVEGYTKAGLDDALGGGFDFEAKVEAAPGDLDEWRAANAENRRRLRERGDDGTLTTSIGPYPVRLQAFHLAQELATHADDAWVPVTDEERDARTGWRARFARFNVAEYERPVEVVAEGGTNRVTTEGVTGELSDADFVEAVMGRLPDDHPLPGELKAALNCTP